MFLLLKIFLLSVIFSSSHEEPNSCERAAESGRHLRHHGCTVFDAFLENGNK